MPRRPLLLNATIASEFLLPHRILPRNRNRTQSPAAVAPPWFRIENSGDSERTIYLHGVVGGDWWGDGASVENVLREIRDFTGSTLNIRINSPGGEVFEGIAIANTLRAHPANITVYVDGLAASIASVIAVSGDKTIMMPNTQMMIHNASGFCMGMAADMRKTADMLDAVTTNIADAYVQRAGGEQADWLALMESETWMNAAEAVAAGLADEIAPARNAPTTGDDRDADELADDSGSGNAERLFEDAMRRVPAAAFRYRSRDDAPVPLLPREARTAKVATDTPADSPVPVGPKIDADAIRRMMEGGGR